MTPERWQAVQRIFHEALERPAGERASFLAGAAAGDAELEAEVATLLASADTDEGFLETPAGPPPEAPRARIGPYDVVREIGHGGMGTVYLAMRADEQFRKRVAIKVVRRGMDTEAVIRRFRQERQILAGLDHPNIARLLDGGNTEEGLPYLVMEHVEGEPVTAWCDRHSLALRERVALFRAICAAVQFAHQNLVVHRDLKPGNILVDEGGAPKLLDFGVAKLLNPEVSGQTLDLTGASVRVFTPEYASPEQIRGERITTATDVYALGVLLHEILTGRRPSGDADRTKRILPADLDTIVAMATREEPARRYASAEQLSEDLRRWLDGLPVKARRDTFPYRSGKFLKRHKAGVVAAALVALSLVVGIVATARQARIAEAEHARAERRLEDVRKLASSFLFEFHDSIRNLPGSTPARELIVRRALEYLGTLAKEVSGDRALQRDLAEAYEKLADVQGLPGGAGLGDSPGALASMKAAVQIREGLVASVPADVSDRSLLAKALGVWGSALATSGDMAGAVAASRRAVELLEAAVAQKPKDAQLLRRVALAHFLLSNRLSSASDNAGCIEEMRKSLALYEGLRAELPRDVGLRRAVALCNKYIASALIEDVRLTKDYESALDGYRRSLEIEDALVVEDPTNALYKRDLSHSLAGRGQVFYRVGRSAEGLADYDRAIALRKELVAADPKSAGTRYALARAYQGLGQGQVASGDARAALTTLKEGLLIFTDLRAADPSNAAIASDAALTKKFVGDAHAARKECGEALRWYERARDDFSSLEASGRLSPGNRLLADENAQALARCESALGGSKNRQAPAAAPSR